MSAVETPAHVRARRQRREQFVRKRSASAARDIWMTMIVNARSPSGNGPAAPGDRSWSRWAAILRGIQTPKCGCVQCAADAMTEQAEVEMMRHARKL